MKTTLSKQLKELFLILFILVQFSFINAQNVIPAFPEAGGGGALSNGGRAGKIFEVTNLNDSGPGSFREACEASGPRIVVFRVCGIIELKSVVLIANPFITIAGQTAPGGGVTLSGVNSTGHIIFISTNDVIIRYLRLRKGFNGTIEAQLGSCGRIMMGGYNIIFDHCSFSWTQDENNTVWGEGEKTVAPHDITFSWSIVSEPLKKHPTSIITGSNSNAQSDAMTDIDFHHNLVANSSHRNPLVKNKTFRFVNNIVYNWSFYASQVGGGGQVDFINNLYKPVRLIHVKSMKYRFILLLIVLRPQDLHQSILLVISVPLFPILLPTTGQWFMRSPVKTGKRPLLFQLNTGVPHL